MIHTCEKFSDIWDVSINLLNKNWNDRNMETLLITDNKTNKKYKNVKIISVGEGLDMPMRAKEAMHEVKTKYIFLTLDDYFITKKIDTKKIIYLLDLMDKFNIDYLSFKNYHKIQEVIDEKEKIYKLDLNSEEDYIVNLYPGIWRTTFFEKTLENKKNIWEYEVSLTECAKKENAVCCVSKGKQFEILDGIRKGKFLHKSYNYLKKNNLYNGNRKVIGYSKELKLFIMDITKRILPLGVTKILKKILKKFGFNFFS